MKALLHLQSTIILGSIFAHIKSKSFEEHHKIKERDHKSVTSQCHARFHVTLYSGSCWPLVVGNRNAYIHIHRHARYWREINSVIVIQQHIIAIHIIRCIYLQNIFHRGKSHMFGTTWGWLNDDRISHFYDELYPINGIHIQHSYYQRNCEAMKRRG